MKSSRSYKTREKERVEKGVNIKSKSYLYRERNIKKCIFLKKKERKTAEMYESIIALSADFIKA